MARFFWTANPWKKYPECCSYWMHEPFRARETQHLKAHLAWCVPNKWPRQPVLAARSFLFCTRHWINGSWSIGDLNFWANSTLVFCSGMMKTYASSYGEVGQSRSKFAQTYFGGGTYKLVCTMHRMKFFISLLVSSWYLFLCSVLKTVCVICIYLFWLEMLLNDIFCGFFCTFSCNLQPGSTGSTHKYLHKLGYRFGSYTKLLTPTNEVI
jgi:hypothetical protein